MGHCLEFSNLGAKALVQPCHLRSFQRLEFTADVLIISATEGVLFTLRPEIGFVHECIRSAAQTHEPIRLPDGHLMILAFSVVRIDQHSLNSFSFVRWPFG